MFLVLQSTHSGKAPEKSGAFFVSEDRRLRSRRQGPLRQRDSATDEAESGCTHDPAQWSVEFQSSTTLLAIFPEVFGSATPSSITAPCWSQSTR